MISLPPQNCRGERNVGASTKVTSSHSCDIKALSIDNVACTPKSNSVPSTLCFSKHCAIVLWAALFATLAFLGGNNDVVTGDQDSVYVPGAGFSGFWFTLGRLQSISNPHDKDYYCFSAGCLGVATTLFTNQTIEDVVNKARSAQLGFKNGSIHRHSVVEHFVDDLLSDATIRKPFNSSDVCHLNSGMYNATRGSDSESPLSRIHVITSTKESWFRWKTSIRTPESVSELREMLIQTTWIPFATGNGMWHQDSHTGLQHMDGGVTALFHPKCRHFLGLPALRMPSLLLNFLNFNLGQEKAVAFWEAGQLVGLNNR